MALLDSKFVALAIALIDKYGADATFLAKGAFVAAEGTIPDGASTVAKIVPPSILKIFDDGRTVNKTKTWAYPSAFTTIPKAFDTLTFDTKSYKITAVTKIYSGDSVALIEFELGK